MQLTCGNHYENIFVKINDFNIGLRPSNFDFNAILTVTIRGGSLQPKGKNFTRNVFTNFHAFPFLVW